MSEERTKSQGAPPGYDLAEELTEADARLMAAAPEMLAALQSALSDTGWLMAEDTRKQCESAIAKANARVCHEQSELVERDGYPSPKQGKN